METIDKVIEVVAQKLGIEESAIDEDSSLSKLGADSLDMLEIINDLEDYYKIDLSGNEEAECLTIKKLSEVVNDNT